MEFSFPCADTLTEDITVTCVPSFGKWLARADYHADVTPCYNDDSIQVVNAACDKRFRLKIPAGAEVQLDVAIDKPDVYCYTVVMPDHPLADDRGYFGIVLRAAGHQKLSRSIFLAYQREEVEMAKAREALEKTSEPDTRRRRVVEPDVPSAYDDAVEASAQSLSQAMSDLSAELLGATEE